MLHDQLCKVPDTPVSTSVFSVGMHSSFSFSGFVFLLSEVFGDRAVLSAAPCLYSHLGYCTEELLFTIMMATASFHLKIRSV